ncbi:MAG: glycosyltransferase family 2 protein [Bacteroidota bacterium]
MRKPKIYSIAVLLTCYNRREKTLNSLRRLFRAASKINQIVDVYLVDDGSGDGTGKAVKNQFPQVNVIQGTGNLFWNGGMRLAWDNASKTKDYDFYFWLNDDTLLTDFALSELLDTAAEARRKDGKPAIVAGSCKTTAESDVFSYGGRNESGPVIPNGEIQPCIYLNGNAVLVPKEIFKALGNLSDDYTHAMGDIDYGLRARQKGFQCYTTKNYIAVCPTNDLAAWHDPEIPLKKRWKSLHSPTGLNLKEYNRFRQKFWGSRWIVYAIKAYLRTFFPAQYNKLLKN